MDDFAIAPRTVFADNVDPRVLQPIGVERGYGITSVIRD